MESQGLFGKVSSVTSGWRCLITVTLKLATQHPEGDHAASQAPRPKAGPAGCQAEPCFLPDALASWTPVSR